MMIEVDSHTLVILGAATAVALVVMQLLIAVYLFIVQMLALRESRRLNKEMYALVRRIEGLTAQKREQVSAQFDALINTLALRLPTTIASRAGDAIYAAEKDILTRLAEIEPQLKDENTRKRLEVLITKMEDMEQTVVSLTAEAVQQVMLESRKEFLEADDSIPH